MTELEYETRRIEAGRAYGNQFRTGRFRVRVDNRYNFAFRCRRTAQRFMRGHLLRGNRAEMYRVDANGQRIEMNEMVNIAMSCGNLVAPACEMLADTFGY